jgi:hypothetical protein
MSDEIACIYAVKMNPVSHGHLWAQSSAQPCLLAQANRVQPKSGGVEIGFL